jgi:hypothetical protein
MNQEQVKSAVRWLIATFGPFIIAHGYANSGTLELAGGVIVSLAPLLWSMITHTQANAVAVVDTIAKQDNTPVKAVIMEPTMAGRELADSLPGKTTVVAGSSEAATLARAA